jgi:hypothetical protein
VYARLFGVNETVVLPAGNYDGKFKLVPPDQPHTLSVPPGMTLLIPSSANVALLFGKTNVKTISIGMENK